MPKKFAWSYSALTGFETCPHQFYRLRVRKDIQEAPSPAMLEGNEVHKALELRVSRGKPLPLGLQEHEKLCQRFVKSSGEVLVEKKLALNADLEETEFFARDVWVRGVFDVAVLSKSKKVLKIFDYKTGKRKPDSDQLKLFAAIGKAVYPMVERIDTAFLWLKSKQVDKESFDAEEVPLIWAEFEPRVERMEAAYKNDTWPCRPSGLCRGWCPVKDCEHWEAKEV